MKKLLPILLSFAMIAAGWQPVSAESYDYTVRIYAGAQGTINGQSVIVLSGLKYGDQVNMGRYMQSVALSNDSKYYVKGIRESGKDNNTVQLAFPVTGDADYVVAYGLKGSSVAYTVRYVDADGNELYPETTFYGNVGDKPVVSYQYVEGYQPQAYNVTKTLSENAAENIFTFTYTRIEGPAAPATPAAPGTPGEPGTAENPGAENTQPGAENAENPGNAAAPGGENGTVVLPAEEVPGAGTDENAPEELEDLDENQVPLANNPVEQIAEVFGDAMSLPIGAKIGICGGTVALLGLAAWLLLFHKRKKKNET